MTAPIIMVVGAGAWGTALASVFARAGSRTLLWDQDTQLVTHMARTRHHPWFLPELELEAGIEPVPTLTGLPAVMCTVLVVPFQALRAALGGLRTAAVNSDALACASKGFELDTLAMAHEIVAATWPQGTPFAQLSGPNFAAEVMRDTPAAMTIAATTPALGESLAEAMHGRRFRAYLSDDVIGVEVGGALKNVIAIAAGIADGLRLGSNTRAALITRGLAEMARFGRSRGGRMETFMGLSGMGDLVLTCTDDQSRNRRFGLALAGHGDVERAAAEVGALVEGVATATALAQNAGHIGIEMPIAAEVAAVLAGERSPAAAVERLLARDPKTESA